MKIQRTCEALAFLEFAALYFYYGVPFAENRIFLNPAFPHLIVFRRIPGSIVEQTNFYVFLAASSAFWLLLIGFVWLLVYLYQRKLYPFHIEP